MKKLGIALKGILIGFLIGFGVYIILGIVLSLIFKDNPVIYMNLPSVAVGICPVIFCIRALKKDAAKKATRSYGNYYGSIGSTIKPKQPAQTQAPRPSTAYTAPQTARTTTTQTTASAPRTVQSAPKAAPKTSTTKAASKPSFKSTTSTPSGLIAKDFITALPDALKGLLAGLVLFFVFGFIANLTMAHPITNLFTFLGVVSLFGCTIVFYVISLKDQPYIRTERVRLKANEQEYAARLEKHMKEEMDILNRGCGVTQESISRYDTACDNIVYSIAANFFDPRYKYIIEPYRHAVYERTWPVFNWRNGKYEVAVGEELADRLHNLIEEKVNERKEEYERKMRQY